MSESASSPALSNSEIAARLLSLAQLLSAQKENPYKVEAYRRAAARINTLGDSVDELVRAGGDLTQYGGIGKAISSAIREMVLTGSLRKLEGLRTEAGAELADMSQYPKLDPVRAKRIYKKLNISSVRELKDKLERGEISEQLGARMEQHVRQALTESSNMLLYKAREPKAAVEEYLLDRCGVSRVEVTGEYRRRVEVIEQLSFLIQTADLASVIAKLERYGGRTPLLNRGADSAVFRLSSGTLLRIEVSSRDKWGLGLIAGTGSDEHLKKLEAVAGDLEELARSSLDFSSEQAAYRALGLDFIPPELREGADEIELAARSALPNLVTTHDLRGELHAHSTSSDGADSIENMAAAARERGYGYIGITDHSQSLKIARGLPEENLWDQIRFIDKLNGRLKGIRVLKSAEVDILADGSLDYPDELMRELDYTVCSIHSRFKLGKAEQTERLLRAMDNRYFSILGHATGRLLLKRPGYEIDIERVIRHAKQKGCFFEINSSPDRLDLSAEHARLARDAGVKIAISTDAHSTRELGLVMYGVEQARRAGLEKTSVLNCMNWSELEPHFKR